MKSILERLENLGKRERVIQTAKKEMKAGETWIYPLPLEKGIEYSISASGSGAATSLRSSLFNGHEGPICESGNGRNTRISLMPEEDGLHKLIVVLARVGDGSGNGSRPEKVSVTVRKVYLPSRARVWCRLHGIES